MKTKAILTSEASKNQIAFCHKFGTRRSRQLGWGPEPPAEPTDEAVAHLPTRAPHRAAFKGPTCQILAKCHPSLAKLTVCQTFEISDPFLVSAYDADCALASILKRIVNHVARQTCVQEVHRILCSIVTRSVIGTHYLTKKPSALCATFAEQK